MRTWFIQIAMLLAIGLSSCTSQRDDRRDGLQAHQAGREAYRAAQAAKRDAKEAERELQTASKDFVDGWNEAKHEDETRRKR